MLISENNLLMLPLRVLCVSKAPWATFSVLDMIEEPDWF